MRAVCKLLALLSFVVLAACDGGISGTGGPIVDMDGVTAVDEDLIIVGEGPGAGDADAAPSGSVAESSQTSDIQFTNNIDATLRPDAILRVINTVNGIDPVVAILNQNIEEPFIGLPGIDFGDGGDFYLSIVPDSYEFDLISAPAFTNAAVETPMQLAGVFPLTLSAGSASTLLLRGLPTQEGSDISADADATQVTDAAESPLDDDNPYPIEVFAVPNQVSTNNQSTVQFRIIHAAPNFDAEGSIDIFVTSVSESSPTVGVPIFSNFDYADASTGYLETPADGYWITATDANQQTQRIPTLDPITPSPGSSTTLIILDDPNGVAGVDVQVLIMNDGDRTGLEAF